VTADDDAELRRAGAALDLHRPQEARQLLATFLASEPDSAKGLALMALAMHECGEPPSRWRPYGDRAAALAPQDVTILSSLADVARRAEDLSGARWYANRALKAGPASVPALNVHALIQLAEGHPGDALRTSARALSLRPDDPDLLVAHGMAQAELGRAALAQADYVAALRIDPQHVFARNNLAIARLDCADLRRAARLLHSAIRDDPRTPVMRQNLEVVAVMTRRLAMAMVMLALGLRLALGLLDARAGIAGAALLVGWTGWWVLRMPAPVKRRLPARFEVMDGIWALLILVGWGHFLVAAIGLRLVLPFAYRRVRTGWQLFRLGVHLP
jgi:Flp pilus assembly protein TadD